jgi:hypothetical protein
MVNHSAPVGDSLMRPGLSQSGTARTPRAMVDCWKGTDREPCVRLPAVPRHRERGEPVTLPNSQAWSRTEIGACPYETG